MKFMAITTILILLGFGLWLLVTAYLYAWSLLRVTPGDQAVVERV